MNDRYLPITGTFLDEVSHNVMNFNWGAEEWERDFVAMKAIGIDMAIVIRCGTERWTMYPSKVLEKEVRAHRPPLDLMDVFMHLGEKYGIKIWVGTYHSNHDWLSAAYDVIAESDLMKKVCDEIWKRYGSSSAFGGWYLSQEIAGKISFNVVKCFQIVGKHCHDISGLQTLISPGIAGCNTGISKVPSAVIRQKIAVSPEQHESEWDWIMGKIKGAVDIVCFQNAHVNIEDQMSQFMEINHRLATKHGLRSWTNLETFDIKLSPHPPIKHQQLLMKMEAARLVGFEKAITFEFSHFMSPNSDFGSARKLYKRYCEAMDIQDRR